MDEPESLPRQVPPAAQEPEPDQEMIDLLAGAPASFRALRRGEIVEGVVVQVGRDEVLVDVGTKAEAVIPASEVSSSLNVDPASVVRVGESVVAMVLETENREGHALLSLARARTERAWRDLQHLMEEDGGLEAEVVDFNRGGLIVNIDGARGFVPLSQVADLRGGGPADESVEARLERFKGRVLSLKVIEVNRRRNRLILSNRAAEQERRAVQRDRLIEELREGETRTGRVTSVADFGAFVDVGGADGLVHVTELAWGPVGHPSQVVRVGDEVEVLVLGVDRERKKIALSLKRLRGEPWENIEQKYGVGQNVPVRITKLATFGAFAEIEPGLEGLIHISELSGQRIQHPKNVVREGEQVTVKILRIEPERRRLGLSLRQAEEEIDAAEANALPMVYGPEGEEEESWMGGARVTRSDRPPAEVEPEEAPEVEDPERQVASGSWADVVDPEEAPGVEPPPADPPAKGPAAEDPDPSEQPRDRAVV